MSVKPIVRDVLFLSRRAEPADASDLQTVTDLLDTLKANQDRCVGMAANMIGVKKAIIAVNMGYGNVVMLNPRLLKGTDPYEAEEGCLSLSGTRKCRRFREIELSYQTADFRTCRQKFTGWTAQIIQHELDHLAGILI